MHIPNLFADSNSFYYLNVMMAGNSLRMIPAWRRRHRWTISHAIVLIVNNLTSEKRH